MTSTQPNHCLRCGYNLRGNTSGKCPECGLGATVIVGVSDPQQFHRAQAALERDGLLVRVMVPGAGQLGSTYIYGSSSNTGWFWVDSTQLDRVESCLDEAGVASWIGNLPIVDRSEPKCPKCDEYLVSNGPEQCPTCGTAFQWVDIEMPEVDPTGVLCPKCGYELTGNTSGRCPECNAPVPDPTLDAIVAAASRSLEPTMSDVDSANLAFNQAQRAWHLQGKRFLFYLVVIVFLTLVAMSSVFSGARDLDMSLAWLMMTLGLVVMLAVCALVMALKLSCRRKSDDMPPSQP